MVSVASAAGSARAALSDAERVLARAGCDTARLDAELLLAEVLDLDRATLSMDLERPIEEPAGRRFAALVARREAREPVAYILGRRDFRHLTLHVDRRVLVPRPETELLVETALELPERTRVVDVGTGSGAVALAVKQERPDLDVKGTDSSAAALAVARGNGRRLGLEVRWRQTDLLTGCEGRPEAVLANLPYVADPELDGLAPEVSRYEPRAALSAGPDGLALLRRLCTQLDDVGFVGLEVGDGQAPAVCELLNAAGFASVRTQRDLAGIERVVVGHRA